MKPGGGDYRFPSRQSVCLSVPPSVCPSVSPLSVRQLGFPNFSQSSFEILTWNLVYEFVFKWFRSSLTFVAFDLLLHELLPFAKIMFSGFFLCHLSRHWLEISYMNLSWRNTGQVQLLSRLAYLELSQCPLQKWSFLDFSLPSFVISTWNLVYEFILIWYRSSLTFSPFDLLLHELLPFAKISFSRLLYPLIYSCRSYAFFLFVGASSGHVLLQQYLQNACLY